MRNGTQAVSEFLGCQVTRVHVDVVDLLAVHLCFSAPVVSVAKGLMRLTVAQEIMGSNPIAHPKPRFKSLPSNSEHPFSRS